MFLFIYKEVKEVIHIFKDLLINVNYKEVKEVIHIKDLLINVNKNRLLKWFYLLKSDFTYYKSFLIRLNYVIYGYGNKLQKVNTKKE